MHTPPALLVASAPVTLTAEELDRAVEEAVAAEIASKPSPETRRSYESCWRFYRAWLTTQQLTPTIVRPKHVQVYLAKLRDDGQKKNTIGRALTVIRVLHGSLVVFELMATNPAREVKGPKVDSTPNAPHIADEGDVHKLLNVPGDSWTQRRDRLIVRLTFGLGWRRSEIARIKLEDIDGETISATVKGSKSITVGLPDWLAEDIFEWRQFAGIDGGPLFRRSEHGDQRQINGAVVYRVVRQSCAKAGIDVVPPHALRRTNITLGGARGLTLKERQLSVGHSSSATTERYDKARDAAKNKTGNVFADLAHA